MQILDRLYQIFQKIKNMFLILGGVGVFAMMLYITIDVMVRNFSSTALVGTYEIVQYYLMPVIILPSMCYALSSGVMPRIVAVTDRMPHVIQRALAILLPLIDMALCVIMGIFSGKYALQATVDKLSFICGVRSLPLYQMYYLVPLAYMMMTIENLFVIIRNILSDSTDILYREEQ